MTEVPVFVLPPEKPLVCLPQHRPMILWAAIVASGLGFMDGSVTAIAMPAIRAALNMTLEQVQWVNLAYLLALAALVLAGGAAGDRFGTARVFGAGIGFFVAASLACAMAVTAAQLIGARALQGIAAALMVPGSMAIIGRAYPPDLRGRALGFWAAAATATTAFGPVLGGALLTWGGDQGWRLIFALNLPLGAVAAWLLWRYALHDAGNPGTPVDLAGAVLASGGLGLMAYAITTTSVHALWFGVASAAALTAFLLWQRITPQPMMPLGLFRNRAFAATNLATFLIYAGFTGVAFYLPMLLISGWQLAELAVTAAFLPVSLLIAVLSPTVGRWADRIGPGPLMAAGSVLVGVSQVGLGLTAGVSAGPAVFWGVIVPLMCLTGVGLGLVVAPLTVAVMASAPETAQGAASGINNTVARVASLVAVAVLGRIAVAGYGVVDGLAPGFGANGVGDAHLAASSAAFAQVCGAAAVLSFAAAGVSIWGLRRTKTVGGFTPPGTNR